MLVIQNSPKPNILYSTIESALHPNVNLFPESSVTLCDNLANYSNDKISQILSTMSSYELVDVPIGLFLSPLT